MDEIIYVDEEKCVGCNKCVRNCVIFDANRAETVDGHSKVQVNSEKCILCGKCIEVCEHEARGYKDDTERFFKDLSGGRKISMVAAPAIRVNFDNYERLFGYLKSRGVNVIYDVSFGADITTWAYLKVIRERNLKSVIAQPCPAIVSYIEKHRTELLGTLSPIHSPTLCTAIYLKRYVGINDDIAFLSPCISKMNEFRDGNTSNYVQYNVTYKKLLEYLEKNNVDLSNYNKQGFDDIGCSLGCVFSRPGGLKENVQAKVKNAWVRQIEGQELAYEYLDEYSERLKFNKPLPLLVDILNCPKGCNGGTGTAKEISIDDADVKLNALKEEKLSEKGKKLITRKIDWLYTYFDNNLKVEDFERRYRNHNLQNLKEPSEKDYIRIYTEMYKTTKSEQRLNCSACGYSSCKEMAKAIYNGLNNMNNCIEFNKQQAIIERDNLERKRIELEAENMEKNRILGEVNRLGEDRQNKSLKISETIRNLALSSEKISGNVNQVNEIVRKIADSTENVSNFAGDVNSSINLIAISIKELNSSLNGLNQNSIRSKDITGNAELKVKHANDIIDKLRINSRQIDKIVEVINNMASQTNMLALNAAIEAAGAGEAGKGFAVVANEVKELAKQTAEATGEISRQIEAMQNDISSVVETIETITKVIYEMTGITNSIAAEVTEQNAVSEEISKSIAAAAEKVNMTNEKLKNIAQSSQNAADSLNEASNGVNEVANNISELSKI